MRYWFREILGWAMIGTGCVIFYEVSGLAFAGRRVCETVVLAMIGIIVFRGGIHLVKVAMAARACERAEDRLYPAPAPPPTTTTRPPAPAVGGQGVRDRPGRSVP
jgi:hypothetical protein